MIYSPWQESKGDSLVEHQGLLIPVWLNPFPNNNVEHTHLDFYFNTVENNHTITLNDKIKIHMDHVFPTCACCNDEFISLDTPKGNRPTYKD